MLKEEEKAGESESYVIDYLLHWFCENAFTLMKGVIFDGVDARFIWLAFRFPILFSSFFNFFYSFHSFGLSHLGYVGFCFTSIAQVIMDIVCGFRFGFIIKRPSQILI